MELMLASIERKNFGIIFFKNRIYIVGGQKDHEITKQCEYFDFEKSTWT